MASIAQCINAERKLRDLLEQEGLPEPDAVEYGYTCIRFFWFESMRCVIVDIDPPAGEEEAFDPARCPGFEIPDDVAQPLDRQRREPPH